MKTAVQIRSTIIAITKKLGIDFGVQTSFEIHIQDGTGCDFFSINRGHNHVTLTEWIDVNGRSIEKYCISFDIRRGRWIPYCYSIASLAVSASIGRERFSTGEFEIFNQQGYDWMLSFSNDMAARFISKKEGLRIAED